VSDLPLQGPEWSRRYPEAAAASHFPTADSSVTVAASAVPRAATAVVEFHRYVTVDTISGRGRSHFGSIEKFICRDHEQEDVRVAEPVGGPNGAYYTGDRHLLNVQRSYPLPPFSTRSGAPGGTQPAPKFGKEIEQ
jgi:hypothetical protein